MLEFRPVFNVDTSTFTFLNSKVDDFKIRDDFKLYNKLQHSKDKFFKDNNIIPNKIITKSDIIEDALLERYLLDKDFIGFEIDYELHSNDKLNNSFVKLFEDKSNESYNIGNINVYVRQSYDNCFHLNISSNFYTIISDNFKRYETYYIPNKLITSESELIISTYIDKFNSIDVEDIIKDCDLELLSFIVSSNIIKHYKSSDLLNTLFINNFEKFNSLIFGNLGTNIFTRCISSIKIINFNDNDIYINKAYENIINSLNKNQLCILKENSYLEAKCIVIVNIKDNYDFSNNCDNDYLNILSYIKSSYESLFEYFIFYHNWNSLYEKSKEWKSELYKL